MEFRVLGPFEVLRGGLPVELRGRKRKAVLALLVLRANEVVGSDRLVEELWGAHPPANATAALYSHVSRLRRELGGDLLATKPWGYVLRAEPGAVDAERFAALVDRASSLPATERAATLAEALALWRGPALADLADEPALTLEAARLDELRLAAVEQRNEAELELGRHAALVPELEALVAANPLRERLRGQLIVALYRAGRQAEALEVYRETRRILVEELGIEPTPELRELEQAILRHDASLAAPMSERLRGAPATAASAPRALTRRVLVAALLVPLFAAGVAVALLVRTSDPRQLADSAASSAVRRTTAATRVRITITKLAATATVATRPAVRHRPKHGQDGGSTTTTHTLPVVVAATTHAQASTASATRPKATTSVATTSARRPVLSSHWAWVFEDSFDDTSLTSRMWHSWGDGVDADERGGRLELAVRQDAVVPFSHVYEEPCIFLDDFDAQVDFQLLDWPGSGGVGLALAAHVGGPPADEALWTSERVGGTGGGGADSYQGFVRADRRSVGTEDLSGTLRLVRAKGVITAYYRGRQDWVRLVSGAEKRFATLVLTVRSASDDPAHRMARIAFDNFHATAANVFCPGPYYPPRRLLKPSY